MEENETEIESTESGASEGSSSEASESGSGTGAAQAAPKQEQEATPFHEHPRFKELVEQKNEFSKRYQDMESRYKQLENQLTQFKDSQPKAPTETDQLLADLKKVDPRLANVIEQQLKAAKTAETVQARLEQFERQHQEQNHRSTLSTAVAKINSLHEVNKVSDFGKQYIEARLDNAYRGGQLNAGDLKAVEAAYAEHAKAIKTYEDNFKREVTKGYVQDKTKDASIPTSVPKGTQAKPAQKGIPTFKNKDDLKSAVIKSFLKEKAAQSDAVNS